MKIGFALPHQGPVATKENLRLVATEAEKMGYDSLWTNERLLVPVKAKTPYPGNAEGVLNEEYKNHLDHLTSMTYVSAITDRIRLGVSVINIPWYNPILLAKRLAAMDVLSDGRITVGVGLAWSEDECDAANVPYRERGRIGEEAIECMLAVWGPDPVEYHGRYFNLEPAFIGPKPVQKPHPPILVGAFVPKALDRAGRLADGFTGCCAPVDALISMMKGPGRKNRPAPRRCHPAGRLWHLGADREGRPQDGGCRGRRGLFRRRVPEGCPEPRRPAPLHGALPGNGEGQGGRLAQRPDTIGKFVQTNVPMAL
jgi:probable F420-dependent oxidoreductase